MIVKNRTGKTTHENHHAKGSTKIGGIHQNIDNGRKVIKFGNSSVVYLALNCPYRTTIVGYQLSISLFAVRIGGP